MPEHGGWYHSIGGAMAFTRANGAEDATILLQTENRANLQGPSPFLP